MRFATPLLSSDVELPPSEDELPYDDGQPMDSSLHRRQMTLLLESLGDHFQDREDIAIEGNMGLYFSELQAKKNEFRAPDVFVVLDTVRKLRKSWIVWKEERTPNLVIELLSESTEAVDRGDKMRIYAKVLRVPEYFLFDPEKGTLEGYRLDFETLSYAPMTQEPRGDYLSRQLKLKLGVRRGAYQGFEGVWLRWLDLQGNVIPTPEEKAHEAEAKAHEAEAKAHEAEAKAHEAEAKAQDLATRLAEYERRFGKIG